MKTILIISLLLLLPLFSCSPSHKEKVKDYTEQTIREFNNLKPPIILIAKSKSMGLYGVTVKDATNKIYWIGNFSSLANHIGDSHEIGDTLIK